MKRYTEEKVDNMRKQKDEELEVYKKEIERQKRFDSQKNASTSQASGEKVAVKRRPAAGAPDSNQGPVQKVRIARASQKQ